MARLESQVSGGYFPTPDVVTARLAGAFGRLLSEKGRLVLVDPCAGMGQAINTIARHLKGPQVRVHTVEMEGTRSAACDRLASTFDGYKGAAWTHIEGDAFNVRWSLGEQDGASLLFLNPPYDTDREFGRVEERFLRRYLATLGPKGVLAFLVPGYALTASAETLAAEFSGLQCFRFPGDTFNAFRQVVVLGRKRATPVPPSEEVVKLIREVWATQAAELPELPEDFSGWTLPVLETPGFSSVELNAADLMGLEAVFKAWHYTLRGGTDVVMRTAFPDPALPLHTREFTAATPPRPAHIAAAMAAGVFNGARIAPDDSTSGLPDLLVKGVFHRSFKTVEEKFNKDGDLTGEIQVQQPELQITVLRLDTGVFVNLVPTAEASEETTVTAAFTTGDLLRRYGAGLLGVLNTQCRVRYNANDPAHVFPIPEMARPLYPAQAHAVRALLTLLGGDTTVPMEAREGEAAILLGEIGSGKTGVSLAAARAMNAKHVLVMCPPHLLDSWRDQAAAVWPELKVRYLREPKDVDAYLSDPGPVLGVMSRETAKLGSRVEGVTKACPKCGRDIPKGDLGAKRARCKHRVITPMNPAAHLHDVLLRRGLSWLPAAALESGDHLYNAFQRNRLEKSRAYLGAKDGKAEAAARCKRAMASAEVRAAVATFIPWVANLPLTYERKKLNPQTVLAAALHAVSDPLWTREVLEAVYAEVATKTEGGYYTRDAIRSVQAFGAVSLEDAKSWGKPFPKETAYSEQASPASQWTGLLSKSYVNGPIGNYTLKDGSIVASRPEGKVIHGGTPEAVTVLLDYLWTQGQWRDDGICDEALYGHIPEPRRVPLATYFCRAAPSKFPFLLLIDEAHEVATEGSAQERAAHRLTSRRQPTILLTGSVMNGYAGSLFTNWWALFPDFRAEFPRTSKALFVDRYGFRKRFVPVDDREVVVVSKGSTSDRAVLSEKDRGEAPGVMPEFLLRHLLPHCVTLQRSDFGHVIPECTQKVVTVTPTAVQGTDHHRLMKKIIDAVKRDRFDKELAGALFGQLAEAPSQLDRATKDTGNTKEGDYLARYPERIRDKFPAKDLVAHVVGLDAQELLPKEAWMIRRLAVEMAEGRNTIIFGWHTELFDRYARIIERAFGFKPAVLMADKVPSQKRQEWIQNRVVNTNAKVLIVNPVSVGTGLNNLVHFATGIFMQNPACNPLVFRQAIGRMDRIGQTKPVRIFMPVYGATAQVLLSDLLHRKVGISLSVDGLDAESALQAVGVGDGYLSSLSVAKVLYERYMDMDDAA